MAFSTLALMVALCSMVGIGARRAFARPLVAHPHIKASTAFPGADGLGALVLGSFSLALTRRILRG